MTRQILKKMRKRTRNPTRTSCNEESNLPNPSRHYAGCSASGQASPETHQDLKMEGE